MESDEFFNVRYLTKSRQKFRSRSSSSNRIEAGGGGGGGNNSNMNSTFTSRRFNNPFCNADSLDFSLSHLAKEFNLLGFAFVYCPGSGPKESDVVNLVNATYELLQLQKRNLKMFEDLENKNLRISSDMESLHANNVRLKESISQFQRNMAALQEQDRQLNSQNKLLQQKLKSKMDEVKKLTSIQQQKETQYLHDTRKREREMDKLKEKVDKLLSDRCKDRRIGMDVMNLLQRKDGTRGKWKTNNSENKQEDVMYQLIIKDFEERHRLILEENISLRHLLAEMDNELSLLVNHYLNSNYQRTEIDELDPGCPGQFNMPIDFLQRNIKKEMKQKFLLLGQQFHEMPHLGRIPPTPPKNISTIAKSFPSARNILEQDSSRRAQFSPTVQD